MVQNARDEWKLEDDVIMHMDETTVYSGPFIFVSYSHMDSEAVREDVEKLIEQGVRIWIDHRSEDEGNLELSDNWFQKVSNAINHPNCCCVLFYISRYSLASRAIHREQLLVRQKAKESGLPYYCVSIRGERMARHLKEAIRLCDDEESVWHNEDYFSGEDDISSMQKAMFNDDRLFIARQDSDECVKQIYDQIAQPLGATDHRGALIFSLEKNAVASRDTGEITLGIYKGDPCEPVAHKSENTRFSLCGRQYIHHGGEVFHGRPLKWRILYIQDAVAVLACSEIVEKMPAVAAEEFLHSFRSLAFTAAESDIVRRIRLMNAKDEAGMDPEGKAEILLLSGDQARMYWWIDEAGVLPGWKLTYKNNVPAPNGFLVTRPKGIRPVIEIAAEDLKRIKGGTVL